MFFLQIILAFVLLQCIAQFCVAHPQYQLGFPCTNESASEFYGCTVKANVLRFFVLGDIGGEEYKISGGGTVGEGHQYTVQGKDECPPAAVKHRPTECQKAVAKAMDLLANDGMAPHFLLNVGDNFYERGVTFGDVHERFHVNFASVYHYNSLNVPWYTIAGNDDWKSADGISPQIEKLEGKWTFPAQHYVAHYEFGNGRSARFIMIDTTVLCGSGSSVFRKTKGRDADKYAKMVANAKQHFKWLRKQLREAKRRRVNFLFLAGHCPLHILDAKDKYPYYPCAKRVKALMAFFQVQAYFSGHEHNLKYADMSSKGTSTKYIVSGAGSHMENAILKGRFPAEYEQFIKFKYPENVGERAEVKGEISAMRGAIDGGAFVGVEIDADKMSGKLNFYAAGMLYHKDGTKEPIEKWHKFAENEIEFEHRQIDMTDENDNICDEFLALVDDMSDDEHFKMDVAERIQTKLGTYFCGKLAESQNGQREKSGKSHFKERSQKKYDWTKADDVQFFAEEAMDALRQKHGITYKELADSFLSDDLIALNSLGKSLSTFYRTKDEKFLVKHIPHAYEVETLEKTLENYVNHLMEVEQKQEKSFLNKIFLVIRLELETEDKKSPAVFILMDNVFEGAKNVPLLTFDVKGVFSYQPRIVQIGTAQRLNDVVLKWYHYFGAEPNFVPRKVMPMFGQGIWLDKGTHQKVAERLRRDFEVLSKNNVNDWSIIFGLYFENNGESVDGSSDRFAYFDATCNQCRNHPNSADLLDKQKMRLYIGIVDFFMPFSDDRKSRYIKGLKKFVSLENESADLMDYVKAGRVWETFGPVPPPMYAQRMLAFSMACAFRWQQNDPANNAPEAIRQALISGFCDSFAKSKQLAETNQRLNRANNGNWMYLMQDKYTFGKYTVNIFGIELFKYLMEKSGKYFWNFLTELAEDQLEAEGQNFVHKTQKFVVKKLSNEEETLDKQSFGNVGQGKHKLRTYALLYLHSQENDKDNHEFFEVIGQIKEDPMEVDQ